MTAMKASLFPDPLPGSGSISKRDSRTAYDTAVPFYINAIGFSACFQSLSLSNFSISASALLEAMYVLYRKKFSSSRA